MNKKQTATEEFAEHTQDIVEDAKALLAATGHVAEEKVVQARKRLSAAIESGREVWNTVSEKTVASAKVADETIREHPYQAIGVAFGVGALLGFMFSRRN